MSYTNTTLTYYLNNIKNLPVLSQKEERTLAYLAKNGDERAKQKLIVCNLKFVVIVAKKYFNSGIPLIDLISEGNLGLIKAIENFDETKGFHFISYAVHWIKQSIIKAIAEKSKLFRLPLSWNNHLYYINKEFGDPNGNNNIGFSNFSQDDKTQSLSKQLGIKEERIKKLLKVSKSHLSLESHVLCNGDNRVDLLSSLKDEKSVNPEKILIDKSIHGDMIKALEFLSPVEKKVIIDRFGLKSNGKTKKLQEVGNELNLTKERIRQIEKKALEKLKKHIKRLEINQYLKV